jgi:hypothetical protein
MSDTRHCDLAAVLPYSEPVLNLAATDTGLAQSWLQPFLYALAALLKNGFLHKNRRFAQK